MASGDVLRAPGVLDVPEGGDVDFLTFIDMYGTLYQFDVSLRFLAGPYTSMRAAFIETSRYLVKAPNIRQAFGESTKSALATYSPSTSSVK